MVPTWRQKARKATLLSDSFFCGLEPTAIRKRTNDWAANAASHGELVGTYAHNMYCTLGFSGTIARYGVST